MKDKRIKIGAWIDSRLKKDIDILRAEKGIKFQDLCETALTAYVDKEMPKYRGASK